MSLASIIRVPAVSPWQSEPFSTSPFLAPRNGSIMSDMTPRTGQPSIPVPPNAPGEACRQLRAAMGVAPQWVYLDHAAVAPLPRPTAAAMQAWTASAAAHGDVEWPRWAGRVEEVRKRAAGLIHASPEQIAFVPNTTHGISCVAEGYPWQPGDNVVTVAHEFPSNTYPWHHLRDRGVEVRTVEPRGVNGEPGERIELDDLAAAIDGRTRILAISWIQYATGWRMCLEDLCDMAHARGVLVMLDAIQGLGLFPIDVQNTPVDFLAADGHKWQLGPEGAGLLYVRREHLERLRPWGVGWHSVPRPYDFDQVQTTWRGDASRWEGGSSNMVGLHGLGASLDLLAACGLSHHASPLAVAALDFAAAAADFLRSRGAQVRGARDPAHRSSIVSFRWAEHDPKVVRQRCLDAHIVMSVRGDWLRISPHGYNDAHDLARFQSAITSALGR